jgi:hypothetical protein
MSSLARRHSALESLLTSLASIFEAELALLVSRTDALVHDLAEDITREELNRLLGLRGAVGECLGRTVGIRRAVDRLLSEGGCDVSCSAGHASGVKRRLILIIPAEDRCRPGSSLLDGQGDQYTEDDGGS